MAKVPITPVDDVVLLKRAAVEKVTKGGIQLTDRTIENEQQQKAYTAEVLAVGPGKTGEDDGKRIPLQFKAGQTVYFAKYGGTEIEEDGEKYILIRAEEILGIKS